MFEENEDKQFMFVENCCKNYPKAESYYELLKLAQKKKLRNVSEQGQPPLTVFLSKIRYTA